jgi:hypothetical protein
MSGTKKGSTLAARALDLSEILNRFPEVEWDRWGGWYEYPAGEDEATVYTASPFGWIERDDGRFDFLVITVYWTPPLGIYHTSQQTSSARYSEEFAERLGNADSHIKCRRIEDDFGLLVDRKVTLAPSVPKPIAEDYAESAE